MSPPTLRWPPKVPRSRIAEPLFFHTNACRSPCALHAWPVTWSALLKSRVEIYDVQPSKTPSDLMRYIACAKADWQATASDKPSAHWRVTAQYRTAPHLRLAQCRLT